jgi:hypothetical protein
VHRRLMEMNGSGRCGLSCGCERNCMEVTCDWEMDGCGMNRTLVEVGPLHEVPVACLY